MTTNNHPANGPVSLERLHQIHEVHSKAAAQSNGGNHGYAMADAVKVIDGAIAAFGAEPVAEIKISRGGYDKGEKIIDYFSEEIQHLTEGQKLYTAPPAPVAMKGHQIRELVNELRDIAIEYHGTQQLRERIARVVRAAMLQAGNSPVTPDGWVACSYRLPPEGYEPDGGAVCYLVWHKNKVDCGPQYSISNVFFLRKHWDKNFSHWMPLPAAPNGSN